MSSVTGIQWTDHTFNIAWGCTKVSPGCKNCYADTLAHRHGFDVWGQDAERRTFGDKHWSEPLAWDRKAQREGARRRVFCSSMADVFEDHPTIARERRRLWPLIAATPNLDWQILTKRSRWMREESPREPMSNVWLGVSVENADYLWRIDDLRATPAAVRFLSLEPLIGPLDALDLSGIDWVIVGGESGHGARVCGVEWIQSVVDQCRLYDVPVFVKQLGSASGLQLRDCKGGDPTEWPEELRVREFPHD